MVLICEVVRRYTPLHQRWAKVVGSYLGNCLHGMLKIDLGELLTNAELHSSPSNNLEFDGCYTPYDQSTGIHPAHSQMSWTTTGFLHDLDRRMIVCHPESESKLKRMQDVTGG